MKIKLKYTIFISNWGKLVSLTLHFGILFDYCRWSLQVPYSHCWIFQLRPPALSPGSFPGLWNILEIPTPPSPLAAACFHSFFWPLGLFPIPLHAALLFSPSPFFHPDTSLSLLPMIILFSLPQASSLCLPSWLLSLCLWGGSWVFCTFWLISLL